MRPKIHEVRKLLQDNCCDQEDDVGFHFVETKKVKSSHEYVGKSWGGYLSVLSLWREYIPSVDGKTGWIKR